MIDRRKRERFLQNLWKEESWVFFRILMGRNCLSCRKFKERNCRAMDIVEGCLEEWKEGEPKVIWEKFEDIFDLGSACEEWR